MKILLCEPDIRLGKSLEEGLANVVLEAMALGTPVISTDTGGMSEIILHGESGWLIPARDPDSLAKQIIEVSKLPIEAILRITENARARIEKYHDQKEMINNMENLYKRAWYGTPTTKNRYRITEVTGIF